MGPGAWNCDDIYQITVDAMNYWDSNGDGQIDSADGWSQSDIDNINSYCDYNGDSATDTCEVHQCIVDYENSWRAENCPESEMVYCDCPFDASSNECEGAWNCNDIYNISVEVINYYDTNYDGNINLEDDIDSDHYDVLIEYCDYNNDGTIDACEVHQCIVDCENAWRDEYCPDYGDVYCECPFYVAECAGAWNCDDISQITVDAMAYWDSNGDGQIDSADGWS